MKQKRTEAEVPAGVACRGCGDTIMWTVTADDKWLPVDAQPAADGTLLLTGGNPPKVSELSGQQLAKARKAQCRLYRSHYGRKPECVRRRAAA